MIALGAVMLAVALLSLPPTRVRGRLPAPPQAASRRPESLRRNAFACAGGLASAALVGGPAGLAVGVVVAAGVGVALRRQSRRTPEDDPFAVAAGLDLLAACLSAGLPMSTSVGAVSAALTDAPAMREGLRRAADLLALGGDAAAAWEPLAQTRGLEQIARLARRSADSGASLAAGASELAATTRERAGDRALIATERAGVAISGPLGLCFLPAFLCLGIAPVVLGLAGKVLDGGVL